MTAVWTKLDDQVAEQEGWGFFNITGFRQDTGKVHGYTEIQMIDDMDAFGEDNDCWWFIAHNAISRQSSFHQRALQHWADVCTVSFGEFVEFITTATGVTHEDINKALDA